MKKRFLIPFVVLCLGFSACSTDMVNVSGKSSSSGGEITEFTLSPEVLKMEVNDQETVTAYVTSSLTSPYIEWKTTGIADLLTLETTTVDGLPAVNVTANRKGSGSIVAMCGDQFAVCEVTVGGGASSSETPVQEVSVNPLTKVAYYEEGSNETFIVSATVSPANATNKTVSWMSSDTAVATVTPTGDTTTVTVNGVGSATITAKAGTKSAQCSLIVKAKGQEDEFTVKLSKSNDTINKGESSPLMVIADGAISYDWRSNNTDVAEVQGSGANVSVKAKAVGQATITVTCTNAKGEIDTAQCLINVKDPGQQSDYDKEIGRWSKAGHLYIHYERKNADYEKWAVWIWQKKPTDSNGSLWGATMWTPNDKVPYVMSQSWMLNSDVGASGTATAVYSDEHGQVLDIDLTNPNIVAGETGLASPLIASWEEKVLYKSSIGFLIVDQTKMSGGHHWVSDGGIESYIEDLDLLFPKGADSYLHIFCKEGSVSSFTTSSGQEAPDNPTASDTSGDYKSKDDITDLRKDPLGGAAVPTSESFLEDRPGTGYQIFVPSFADGDGDGFGDLRGIINKLDYLQDLGIEVLWLTPIQKSGSYHGYDVTDYYKIDSKFGTMEDYQELMYKAHKKGMKVLMDMVINHTSKNNVLFTKSQRAEVGDYNGKPVEYRNMYLWKFKGQKVTQWNWTEEKAKTILPNGHKYYDDYTASLDDYESINVEDANDWYQDGASNYYYFGKFGSGMAELNYSCQATRDYMIDMCKYWLSFGLDGFRLDAIKHIYLLSEFTPEQYQNYKNDGEFKENQDGSTSGEIYLDASDKYAYDNQIGDYVHSPNDYSYHRRINVMFWKEFAGKIKSAYPNCFLVGENFSGWNKLISAFYEALDSQFDFSTYYHLNESTGSGAADIAGDIQNTLNINKKVRDNHINGAFTSNHDVARFINHAGSTTLKQHHTEISSTNSEVALQRARWFSSFTILSPGVSWIYYGDEIGMTGNINDKVTDSSGNYVEDHGNNIDRWYRQPMRWGETQGKDQVTLYQFSGLEVNWDNYSRTIPTVEQILEQESSGNNTSLHTHFKALCHAKNHEDYPTYGYIVNQWRVNTNANISCMKIYDGVRCVNVFINATGSTVTNFGGAGGDNVGQVIGGTVGANNDSIPAYGFVVIKSSYHK